MALTGTTRLGIRYPNLAQAADLAFLLQTLAQDADGIVAGYGQGVHSGRPAAGVVGRFFWETDTQTLFYDDGANWQAVNSIPAGSITSSKYGPLSISAQTDNYTLVLADAWKIVELANAAAKTITIPLNSSQAFPVGTTITVVQTGAGQVTIAATGGVTLRTNPGAKLASQWAMASLYKRATDEWVLGGNIVP